MRTGMARDTKKDWQEREEKKLVPSLEGTSFLLRPSTPPSARLRFIFRLFASDWLFFFVFFSWLHSTGSRFV